MIAGQGTCSLELIEEIREISGVRGIHLQAIEAEELIPEILRQAGLANRPAV